MHYSKFTCNDSNIKSVLHLETARITETLLIWKQPFITAVQLEVAAHFPQIHIFFTLKSGA